MNEIKVYKNSVYLNKPTTVDELKTEIEAQIHNIDENSCKRVFQNMIRRLDACQAIGGGQFQYNLWL